MESRGLEFYGMDPTFVIGSSMYAGQISIGNFYAANEIRNQSTWSTQFESRTMKLRRIPYGFFPHQVSPEWPTDLSFERGCQYKAHIYNYNYKSFAWAVGEWWFETR